MNPGTRDALEESLLLIARNAFVMGYLASRPNVDRETIDALADDYCATIRLQRREMAADKAATQLLDSALPTRLLS